MNETEVIDCNMGTARIADEIDALICSTFAGEELLILLDEEIPNPCGGECLVDGGECESCLRMITWRRGLIAAGLDKLARNIHETDPLY